MSTGLSSEFDSKRLKRMMSNSTGKRNASLLDIVKVRESSKKVEDKKQCKILLPYIPKDCISNILVRLPLCSLLRSNVICKQWHNIISSSIFIDAHLRRSESVLIFQTSLVKETSNDFSNTSFSMEKPHIFSVEGYYQSSSVPTLWKSAPIEKYSLQFLEFKDGKCKKEGYNINCGGSIRATCNGLILLDNKLKKGGLIVLNPVTRKLITLSPGTLNPPHRESYGFSVSNHTGLYKVVHLFHDELGYTGCEILNLGERMWRAVNGPSFGLLKWFGYEPVSAIGALHWIPEIDRSEYIVSMDVDEEKFHAVALPKSCRAYDRIIEMNCFLAFVTHEDINQIDIWILKDITVKKWMKHHSITVGCLWDMVPLFCLRINEEMIFGRNEDGSFNSYDFNLQVMTKFEMEAGRVPSVGSYLPHINSLVSWSRTGVEGFV